VTDAAARPLDGLVLILGGRGSGKTVLLQKIERRYRTAGHHFTIWDMLGYWKELPGRTVVRSDDAEEAAMEAIRRAPTTFVVDEAADAYPSDHRLKPKTALTEIARKGRQASAVGRFRRRGPVAAILAAQRPMDIAPGLKNLVDRLFLLGFPATAASDIAWVEDAVERIQPGQGRAIAALLPRLTVGQYVTIAAKSR